MLQDGGGGRRRALPHLWARHVRALRAAALGTALCLGLTTAGGADVVTLKDGDRVRGKTVARGTKRLRLQTAYGLLIIPLEKIDKITHDDGTEEVIGAPAAPEPVATPPPPPPVARLALVVTGKTFWYAWDPKAPPADPSLRLEVKLGDQTIAAYVDGQVDEGEIPGVLVNAFSFAPEAVTALAGPESRVLLPENRPGRIPFVDAHAVVDDSLEHGQRTDAQFVWLPRCAILGFDASVRNDDARWLTTTRHADSS